MDNLITYLDSIENGFQKQRMTEIFNHILTKFDLDTKIAWNQPMFTHHGTFIIGFSVSKNHISMSPELKTMQVLNEKIIGSGYETTKQLIKINNDENVNFDLIDELIEFNLYDKKDVNTFWRK